jgi:hypothetical protein
VPPFLTSFLSYSLLVVAVSSFGIFPTGIAPAACLLAGRAAVTGLVRQLQFSVLSMAC